MRKLDKDILDLLEAEVVAGYISKRKHPIYDIFVYKYTKECQYKQHWNKATLMARGLILDADGNIIAWPLSKFFNYEEIEATEAARIMTPPYRVYEKVDGSMGILVKYNGEYFISTQGSFDSDQAIWATKYLHDTYEEHLHKLDCDRYTYMFEIIYPENRIIVDYKDYEGLIFLAMRDKETGEDVILPNNVDELMSPFTCATRYREFENKSYKELKDLDWENAEGFVIHSKEGRLKIKFEKYFEIVKLKMYLDEPHLLNKLYDAKEYSLEKRASEIRQKLQEEMLPWFDERISYYKRVVENKRDDIIEEAAYVKFLAGPNASQKDIALLNIQRNDKTTAGLVFGIFNGRDIRNEIFKHFLL